MSRGFSQTIIDALSTENFRLALFVQLDFSSTQIYANSTVLDITWGGQTWLGLSDVADLDAIREDTQTKAANLNLTLAGIPRTLVNASINETYQGRPVNIYLGLLNADYTLMEDPSLIWAGRMDTMATTLGETATIVLKCESNLVDWARPKIRRYTDSEQQARYPGDLGLQFINKMKDVELTWGES